MTNSNAGNEAAPIFQAGTLLHQQGRLEEARARYQKVLELNPRHFDAAHLLGIIAVQTGNLIEGVALIDKAIAINSRIAPAHYNVGVALANLGEHELAISRFDKAIQLQPDYVDAWYNRGVALEAVMRGEEAVKSYDKAIKLKPDYGAAYNNRGNALRGLKRLEEAVESYTAAIRLMPAHPHAYVNRGNTKSDLNRHEEALVDYEVAIGIDPDHPLLLGARLYSEMKICAWQNRERHVADIVQRLDRGQNCSASFPILAVTDSPRVQYQAAKIWVESKYPANPILGAIPHRAKRDRIRLGYFSMDFRDHPVSFLFAGVVDAHNREKFEVTAFSYGPDTQDNMHRRLETAFDNFIDVQHMSDRDVAALARRMEIDIAVDLGGHTSDARTGIFALRAAPIQVNYLGYPGTMAAAYIDYIVADSVVIGRDADAFYAEKVVRLPNCYQANDATRTASTRQFTRAELGLPLRRPNAGFVFCCFNSSYKISPDVFDVWMRILKKVDGSVLWLLEDNKAAALNLRKEAVQRGIDANRLVFASFRPHSEHLSRLREADLVLDTLPYNAHTTTSDALWIGVPVLTCCMGEAFAGRVAASLLRAIDIPELITTTLDAYEALAVGLARDPDCLDHLRRKIENNRSTRPLFNTIALTRHIESAYTTMYERRHASLSPESFNVR